MLYSVGIIVAHKCRNNEGVVKLYFMPTHIYYKVEGVGSCLVEFITPT